MNGIKTSWGSWFDEDEYLVQLGEATSNKINPIFRIGNLADITLVTRINPQQFAQESITTSLQSPIRTREASRIITPNKLSLFQMEAMKEGFMAQTTDKKNIAKDQSTT